MKNLEQQKRESILKQMDELSREIAKLPITSAELEIKIAKYNYLNSLIK